MLVNFRVENFRSISKPIELNLRPAPRLRNHKSHVVNPAPNVSVLKTSLIYGANASGKSNIVKAIKFLQSFVVDAKASDEKIEISPFRITQSPQKTSSFYIEFTISDFHLSLTLKVNDERVEYEKLARIHKNKEELIYERHIDRNYHKFTLGICENTPELDIISKYTPSNSSLIGYISQNQSIQNDLPIELASHIRAAYLYFTHFLVVVFPDSRYGGFNEDIENGAVHTYAKRLKEFDTGIDSIEVEKIEESIFSEQLIKKIKNDISRADCSVQFRHKSKEYNASLKNDDLEIHEMVFKHKDEKGNSFNFSLAEESDGTIRIFDLIPALHCSDEFTNVDKATLIIDEFDRSLHPNLSRAFFENFLSCNGYAGQLIVTTHQAELLDLSLLRRDEIWFTQKEWDHSTSLYSLNDYGTRHDKDIRKAYLEGLFGAIPVVKS